MTSVFFVVSDVHGKAFKRQYGSTRKEYLKGKLDEAHDTHNLTNGARVEYVAKDHVRMGYYLGHTKEYMVIADSLGARVHADEGAIEFRHGMSEQRHCSYEDLSWLRTL